MRGDDLFKGPPVFNASKYSTEYPVRAASLAVVAYLFEACDCVPKMILPTKQDIHQAESLLGRGAGTVQASHTPTDCFQPSGMRREHHRLWRRSSVLLWRSIYFMLAGL